MKSNEMDFSFEWSELRERGVVIEACSKEEAIKKFLSGQYFEDDVVTSNDYRVSRTLFVDGEEVEE
ncbi:hypothetical protein [Enterococcus sp. LJL51]|uniref:hypothetical protein n=1 Tax=Enterococcus sp. LJL51 TaxID=3416656 RepID=UPI003CEB9DC4